MGRLTQWMRWQAPYLLHCYAYFPITLTKRVLLRGEKGYLGLELPSRRFWDKWGFLSPGITTIRSQKPIWINMNSGGEVLIGWRLLKQLNVEVYPYVLSTESFDSYDLLCRTYGQNRTFFPPWDTALPVGRALRKLQPRMLVFVKNAYFPILLQLARRAGIKTVLVNAVFSQKIQVGNPFMQRALALGFHHQVDAIAVQDEEEYRVARSLGIPKERLEVTGNIYSDLRHLRITPEERSAMRRELFLEEADQVIIVGSTHPGEELVLNEAFRLICQSCPSPRFIVAPRQIHEADGMEKRLIQAGWRVARRSRLNHNGSENSSYYDILVLDTFGELGRLYGIADVAYVGASLVPLNERRAGHNVLEPLAHGIVPVFGPHMNEFKYATSCLLKVDPTLEVDSSKTLARRVMEILEGKAPVAAIRQVGEELIAQQAGAVDRTVAFLKAMDGQ